MNEFFFFFKHLFVTFTSRTEIEQVQKYIGLCDETVHESVSFPIGCFHLFLSLCISSIRVLETYNVCLVNY